MAFDPTGPLPTGTTVLEASAGTGKTFTIAALATRYVAEGLAELPELMVVTFGRAATQELRERVRERFVTAERGLRDRSAARTGADELLRQLAHGTAGEVELRRRRLAAALAGFDGATIATTHGFCQQVLAGLGILGDTEPGATFVESTADLVAEVVDDLYLATYATAGAPPALMTPAVARQVAAHAVGDPNAVLEPADADPATEAGQRVRLAAAARVELARRKRQRRLLDYDDLVGLLHDVLRRRPEARQRVRERYRVVLVDEFQDTDDVQWEVLRLAFHGHLPLVLVGDPKQAVYAFRGGDVQTYLRASGLATTHEQLDRNWRSDAPLLAALDRLYGGAALGDPRIVVRPVAAGGPRIDVAPVAGVGLDRASRLSGAPALRVRRLPRPTRSTRLPAVARVRSLIAADVAADVVGLLDGPTRLAGAVVHPADVAVLVRTNAQGVLVRDALAAARVPAVLAGATSVFATPSARAWLVLLQAVQAPNRALRVRAAALTPLLGWSAARLDARGDAALDELGALLRGWSVVFAERGVAALFEVMSVHTRLVSGLLAELGGERALTDLRHLAQELHRASVTEGLGLTALLDWLARRRGETGVDGSLERSRRLESDAESVSVLTVHGSKGLEWPIVYVPFGWDRWEPTTPDPLRAHDESGRRVLDVGGPDGPGRSRRLQAHRAEDAGEELRLLYVALTRAQSQVVTWWAPTNNTPGSAMHRLLFGDRDATGAPPLSVPVPAEGPATARLAAFGTADDVSVEVVTSAAASWSPPEAAAGPLSAAVFDRTLDLGWSRTSYTALTVGVHTAPGVASEPEVPELTDEPEVPQPADEPLTVPAAFRDDVERQPVGGPSGASAAESAIPVAVGTPRESPSGPVAAALTPAAVRTVGASPMAGLPGGTAFGTLVHAILEAVDTSAVDLRAELGARCRDAVGTRVAWVAPEVLADTLVTVLETPLTVDVPANANADTAADTADGDAAAAATDAAADDAGSTNGAAPRLFRLCDIAPADRLCELAFELPLAGGDLGRDPAGTSPRTGATLHEVAELIRVHLPVDDPLAPYPDLLESLTPQALRGYLTGSIDTLLRVHGTHLVVDYKTNRLGDDLADYAPDQLAGAMLRAHYPLQALLYSVAAHRFLRWRLPGYDVDTHLGGVRYLFVRGMAGDAAAPPATGVSSAASGVSSAGGAARSGGAARATGMSRASGVSPPTGVFAWRPPSALVTELSDLLA